MTIFFVRDCPEIWKLEIPLYEFYPISVDPGELGIPNLKQVSLIKCYSILQNARITAFTVSELLREKKEKVVKLRPLPPPRLSLISETNQTLW